MKQDLPLKQSKVISEQVIFKGKWLGLKYTNFSIADKIVNNWETVFRTTSKKNGEKVDGVQIIPIIQYHDQTKCSEVVLIANFRPPINRFSLEFPSGLVENDNYQENAKRELLQQTGYKLHKFIKIPNPTLHTDPWKSNESELLYLAIIDGDDPNNYQGQKLDNEQNIKVHRLKLDEDFMKTLYQFAQKNNYALANKVWSISLGICFFKLING